MRSDRFQTSRSDLGGKTMGTNNSTMEVTQMRLRYATQSDGTAMFVSVAAGRDAGRFGVRGADV